MKEKLEMLDFLREIQMRFSRLHAHLFHQADLTLPQFALLIQLMNLGELPMTEISEKLFISKPAVTSLVDRLEKKKLLKRRPSPKDRRITLIAIEKAGEARIKKVQSFALNFFLKTLDEFNNKERGLIMRFYQALLSKMESALINLRKEK